MVTSIAAIVWSVAQPGTLVSDVAIAAIVVGGATTVLTNMNPLIPLDGYFALSDWLEIPNLRQRALATSVGGRVATCCVWSCPSQW